MARVRAAQLLVRAVCPLRLPAALAPLPLSRSLHSSAFTRWPRLQASIAAEEATQAQKSLSFHVPSANAYPPHGHTTFLHENEAENEEENVGLEVEIENPAGDDAMGSPRSGAAQGLQTVKLKVLHEGQHNLTDQSIPWHTWRVLRTLHDAGHEAYVVGGSVRDLFLGETPKDFDVLSTADPYQVKRLFQGRAIVVGRRFPICHVRTHGIITEVSSFSTESKDPFLKGKGRKKQQLKLKKQRFNGGNPAMNSSEYEWDDRDTARWRNSLKRDFTVNGLMYEPFKRILYDYVGGIQDLKFRKVRTILPADSLNEDPARYLRAIRIAARLGLSLDSNVSRMLDNSAPAVALVGKSRLMSEVHIMLAYGAAEASLRLLWRFRLLELLLPLQVKIHGSIASYSAHCLNVCEDGLLARGAP